MIEITRYHDAVAAFRATALRPDPEEPPLELRQGTLLRIDGKEHTHRRRALGVLFAGGNDERLRQETLVPLLRDKTAETLELPTDDGSIRIDLVAWCTDVVLRFAARIIGLQFADEDIDDLLAVHAAISTAMSLRHRSDDWDRDALLASGLAAKRAFDEKYLAPALAARRSALGAGERATSRGALDFLDLVASEADPSWASHEIVVRETLVDFINAGTVTTVDAVLHAIDELFRHIQRHPEAEAKLTDDAMLKDAIHEALRLHESAPGFNRIAQEDFRLVDGTEVRIGERLIIRIGQANRDPSVFGDDADQFRPGREVPPTVYPYGLAFGSGRHMCYGLPLVMAGRGTTGSAVCMLKQLFELGIRPDPTRPCDRLPASVRDAFASYPALIRKRAQQPAVTEAEPVAHGTAG